MFHVFLILLFLFVLLSISQFFFESDEFINFLQLFVIGILYTIIYRLLFGTLDTVGITKLHPLTISLHYTLIHGLLRTALALALYYVLVHWLNKIEHDGTWKNSAFLICGFFSGLQFVYAFFHATHNFFSPNYFGSLIFIITSLLLQSCLTGLFIYLFEDSFNMIMKIIYALLAILAFPLISLPFYLLHLNNYWVGLFVYVVITMGVLFYFYKKELD